MEIGQIKELIERALCDGRLSRGESEQIKAAIYHNKKITPEQAQLFRELQDKVWKGEILLED
jgi:hypothetical protein